MTEYHSPNVQGPSRSLIASLKSTTGLLGLGCMLLSAPAGAMAQVDWVCSEGGSFESPSCWSDGMVPSSGDYINFDLGAAYSVLFPEVDMGFQEVNGVLINGDDVSFNILNSYNYFEAGPYLYIESSSEERDNEAILRLITGEINTSKFYLIGGSLDVSSSGSIMCTEFAADAASSVMVDVNAGLNYTAISLYNAFSGSIDLGGSLVINTGPGESGMPLGSSRTVLETNFDGSLTIGQPFTSVYTNPPIGREFEITGNESGSTSIVATLIFSSTYTDEEFNEQDELTSEATAVVTGDLTDNGYDDIVLVMPENKIRVYETTFSGGLLGPYEYPVGNDPVDAEIGDYDGNGFNDIVVLNQTDSTCSVYLNLTGDPSSLVLYDTYSTPKTPTAVVNCDLGDDEDEGSAFLPILRAKDIVIVAKGDGGDGGRATGYRGTSDGLREVATVIIEEEPDSADPADDEEKKDEDDDIVIGHGRAAEGLLQGTGSPSLTLLRGNSDGTLTILQSGVSVSSNPTEAAALTIDGNNYVAVSTEGGSIELYRRSTDSSGTLSLDSSLQVGDSVLSIGASDLDGDSRKDIVASVGSMGDSTVILYRNKSVAGSGIINFEQANEVSFDEPTGPLAVGVLFSLDGDKKDGVAGSTAPTNSSAANLFTGYFFESDTPECIAADFNGDNVINGSDLGQLISHWGACVGCPEDLNGDGLVNGSDLGLLFNVWGDCID